MNICDQISLAITKAALQFTQIPSKLYIVIFVFTSQQCDTVLILCRTPFHARVIQYQYNDKMQQRK